MSPSGAEVISRIKAQIEETDPGDVHAPSPPATAAPPS